MNNLGQGGFWLGSFGSNSFFLPSHIVGMVRGSGNGDTNLRRGLLGIDRKRVANGWGVHVCHLVAGVVGMICFAHLLGVDGPPTWGFADAGPDDGFGCLVANHGLVSRLPCLKRVRGEYQGFL